MKYLFCILWLIIGWISAFDAYLLLVSRSVVYSVEQNPVVLRIIINHSLDVAVGLKFAGTIASLGLLAVVYNTNRTIGIIATGGTALFQVGLLMYLLWG